ncbi:WbqC family protein [Streptomyces coelicoflavus]|uniref:WbqC family protein n=1 Tax=Streptomyces coelicoflavus TaxID=285562 RepID=UPI00350E54F0
MLDALDTGRIAAVATVFTRLSLGLLGWQGQVLGSSDLPSRPGRSQRLADLCAVTSARAYTCGTGGMTYLDLATFTAEGVAVMPFQLPTTSIWSSGRRLSALSAVAELGPHDVAARLPTNRSYDQGPGPLPSPDRGQRGSWPLLWRP